MAGGLPPPDVYVGVARAAIAAKLGITLDTTEGSVWDGFFSGMQAAMARSDQAVLRSFDAQILDRATFNDLDAYCRPRGPIRRKPAAPAIGLCSFRRPTSAAGAGTIPAGTQIRAPYSGSSQVFVTTADATLASGDLTTVVYVAAATAGAAGNVGVVASGLALTGSPGPLFDATLTPDNTPGYGLTVVGGNDEEKDAPFRERQRLYEQGRQGATRAAVVLAALSVPQVAHVVTADCFTPAIGGYAVLYCGDMNWSSLAPELAANDPMLAGVAYALDQPRGRGFGAPILVRGISQVVLTVTGVVTMTQSMASYNATALRAAAQQAALAYFTSRADPYAFDERMCAARIARIDDTVANVALTVTASEGLPRSNPSLYPAGVPLTLFASPLSPSAVLLNSGLPMTLTRYTATLSTISIDVVGPL